MHRLSVRYSGRVQGVGFRATVAELAQPFAVQGRISNVLDGTVDLQAEGEQLELYRFRDAIAQRLERNIVAAHERLTPIDQPTWTDFQVGPELGR